LLGLYVHIPFCAAICNYCNFNRGLFDPHLKTRYLDALIHEIRSAEGTAVWSDNSIPAGMRDREHGLLRTGILFKTGLDPAIASRADGLSGLKDVLSQEGCALDILEEHSGGGSDAARSDRRPFGVLIVDRANAPHLFIVFDDDGTLELEQLSTLLTPEVKLFAFTHISNSLGTINPVAELCRKAHAVGALTLMDAAQSVGHLSIDMREMGCDFLAFSGHKMCGPTGIGVLYGRADILDSMPPWHGGGEMIVSVHLEKSAFKKAPHRFEAGTPNIAGAIGLAAAIDYIEGIGRPAIFDHDLQLARYAAERLTELPGTRVFGPKDERGALVGFVMDAAHPHDLTTFADQYGLAMRGGHHCNQPLMRRFGVSGTTRASFYFYNTMEEIDRMIEILHGAVRFFS